MSFNNEKIVAALNSLTVPVYLSNDLVVGDERRALTRIHQEGYRKKLSVGTVHCFILAPDGALLDTIHVALASPQRILEAVERAAQEQKIVPGSPLIPTQSLSLPPTPRGGLRLHIVARYLERKPDGSLGIVTGAGGNWSALPGEDWLTLTPSDFAALRTGERIQAERLLTHFYPPTENNDLTRNRFVELTWKGEPLPNGILRLRGSLVLKHSFSSRDDQNTAQAGWVGYADSKTLTLVTTKATYNNQPYAVAVTTT